MLEFVARYYDGVTSREHHVTVSVAEATLTVRGTDTQRTDPLDSIRVSARLANTPRSVLFADGAKCETEDQAAVADLATLLGGSSRSLDWVHRLESSWRLALASGFTLLLLGVAGFIWGVPLLAEYAAMKVPARMARAVGRDTLSQLDGVLFHPTKLSVERRAELDGKFAALTADHPDLSLHLEFRAGDANAFALPDGTVVMTDDLVALAKDDQELLAVLGHEIGHVAERHALRLALENSLIGLFAFAYFGDVNQVAALMSALPAILSHSHYSRSHEAEADTFALGVMQQHGIDRRHFADSLERLQQAHGVTPDVLKYVGTHPPTAERIARFR